MLLIFVYLIFVSAYFTLNTVHHFEFKVPSYSLHMRTNKENGVADEAIVNEWVVSIAPGDFEVVKKRWGRALLSVKYCCIATLEVLTLTI